MASSQFAEEAEVLFPPCTMLLGGREGSGKVQGREAEVLFPPCTMLLVSSGQRPGAPAGAVAEGGGVSSAAGLAGCASATSKARDGGHFHWVARRVDATRCRAGCAA